MDGSQYFLPGPIEEPAGDQLASLGIRLNAVRSNTTDPATSERQRKFMGAELGRLRRGEKMDTGMTEEQLRDYARKRKGRRP